MTTAYTNIVKIIMLRCNLLIIKTSTLAMF